MVKAPCFQCKGRGSIPGRGNKIPHAAAKQTNKQKSTKKGTLHSGTFIALSVGFYKTIQLSISHGM